MKRWLYKFIVFVGLCGIFIILAMKETILFVQNNKVHVFMKQVDETTTSLPTAPTTSPTPATTSPNTVTTSPTTVRPPIINSTIPLITDNPILYTFSCQPRTNIAFLKVHKTGSSTMLNMFYRFADRYSLNLVLPKSDEGNYNYLGYGKTLNTEALVPIPEGQTFNILCNHVVYSREAFRKVMPRDTLYIGILRHPVANFMSAFSYYGSAHFMTAKLRNHPLSELNLMTLFLQNPYKYAHTGTPYYLHNKMSFDFGLENKDYENTTAIKKFISDLDEDFVLVIILEHLDESLVLMKRILCWEFRDILYLPVNVRYPKQSEKSKISELKQKNLENLKNYNKADFMLYDFFKKRLLYQIKDAGRGFKAELQKYRQIQSDVLDFCQKWLDTNFTVMASKWNLEFVVSPTDCLEMMRDELQLVKEKIKEANEKYSKWLKSNKEDE